MNTESDEDKVPMRYILREISDNVKSTGKDVHELKGDMTKIKTIVLGDKDAETPGLAQRVNSLEKKGKNENKIYAVISGISTGIGIAIAWLIEHAPKLFKAAVPVILIFGDILVILVVIAVRGLSN